MSDSVTPEKSPEGDYIVRGLRHELVQPLHSLGLLIDLAPAAVRDDANAAWLGKLKRSVDGLTRMVSGLAEISRLDLQPRPSNRSMCRWPSSSATLPSGWSRFGGRKPR